MCSTQLLQPITASVRPPLCQHPKWPGQYRTDRFVVFLLCPKSNHIEISWNGKQAAFHQPVTRLLSINILALFAFECVHKAHPCLA